MKVIALDVGAYTVPTAGPESDGTFAWDSTTVVVVRATADGLTGLGYTYGPAAIVALIRESLAPIVTGADPMAVTGTWVEMVGALRNAGVPGIGAMAVSALDIALWDLKARLLDLPLATLLDAVHDGVPLYGSGGFTSYELNELVSQLTGWVEQGVSRVKMKVGRSPNEDLRRVSAVREAIGDGAELFVDANGAYTRKQALGWARRFADLGVTWLEEPVSSDDLPGLRLLRDSGPPGLDIAAGEYGYTLPYFHRMADAVDCLQADVTRCGGITAYLRVGALCDGAGLDLSAHCAPQISAHASTPVWHLRHLEYFHDHVRIERLLFDGVLEPTADGLLVPDRSVPGTGLALREHAAREYRVA